MFYCRNTSVHIDYQLPNSFLPFESEQIESLSATLIVNYVFFVFAVNNVVQLVVAVVVYGAMSIGMGFLVQRLGGTFIQVSSQLCLHSLKYVNIFTNATAL